MPLKQPNPFIDSTKNLTEGVNPFLTRFSKITTSENSVLLHADRLINAKGNWRNLFPNNFQPKEIVVEVGCHMGHSLMEMAKRRPDVGFIGFDITLKRVVTTSERFQKSGLKNILCVYANAIGFEHLFAESEVDGVVVFFPDPWPKTKHEKNRLFQPKFCNLLKQVIREDGFLWLKTDQESYFKGAEAKIKQTGFYPEKNILNYFGNEDIPTLFQNMFTSRKVPFFQDAWRNRKIFPN